MGFFSLTFLLEDVSFSLTGGLGGLSGFFSFMFLASKREKKIRFNQ